MLRYAPVILLVLSFALAACRPVPLAAQAAEDNHAMDKLVIRVRDKAFAATLLDNATARAFRALLPLSITMTELNGNEKFSRLSSRLPTQPSTPSSIQAGDLMLYGSDTLVLFYESFSTTYSYTKIGRVDQPAGLAAALGSGDVTVTFELQRPPSANRNEGRCE